MTETANASDDAYEEYVQDLVADEYQGFRDAWVKTAFSGTDEEKAKYKDEDVARSAVACCRCRCCSSIALLARVATRKRES